MTDDADGRAGVGNRQQGIAQEADKDPGNGRVAFGICFWRYLDRNLSPMLSDFGGSYMRLLCHPLNLKFNVSLSADVLLLLRYF